MNRTTALVDDARPASGDAEVLAALDSASKVFGGTVALADASFELRAGEVLALLGENGAGKSTCVKLLAGVYRPDAGCVRVDGREVSLTSPATALDCGIAVMHQHPGLFPDLSVAENIFMGRQPRNAYGVLRHSAMREDAKRLLDAVGLSASPATLLGRLRSSEQQLVEIARALSVNARVLIMDEPTAALSTREVDRLFEVVDQLRRRGVAMMFVGHRMEEVFRVADRIAVLRDGRVVKVASTEDLPQGRAVQLMVGRPLSDLYPALPAPKAEVVLQVEGLGCSGDYRDISFTLKRGEILGIGGLVGSGRTEIARALFGISPHDEGRILLSGQEARFQSANDAMRAGVAYVSEDRIGQSLVMDFPILTNATMSVLDRVTSFGLVSRRREVETVETHLQRLRLRFRDHQQTISELSGGNQQKVVLSKWLATQPRVLILDEPTQGVDVQTKAEVHAMMADLASQGLSILMISSELPELLGMSHRVLVLREGRITAEFAKQDATQEKVILAATGARVDEVRSTESSAISNVTPLKQPLSRDPEGAANDAQKLKRFWDGVPKRELGLFAIVVAMTLGVSVVNPRMLGMSNLTAVSMDVSLLLIVAAAQMLVILTRGIDLSVASVMGLTAYVSASLMRAHPEVSLLLPVAAATVVGLACGVVNGMITTYGGVPAIVVTLGTLSFYRGLDSMLASGSQVSADQVPEQWLSLASNPVAGLPAIVWIALLVAAALGWGLAYTRVGRELYAIGSNPQGAQLIGINVKRRLLLAFAVAGTLAGLTGALWASRYATIDSRTAFGYELTVIAVVVVGGVAIRGGSGGVLGVLMGVLALLVIRNGLVLLRVDPLWLQAVYGLVILVTIALDAVFNRRAAQRNAKRRTA